MLSWFTGARNDSGMEGAGPNETFIEPPETPAPVFAVRAFKHALFGTPQPVERTTMPEPRKAYEPKPRVQEKAVDIPRPRSEAQSALPSPSKAPAGILMTPGTAAKSRKTVSFGAHVVDNEGKKSLFGRSGLPNDCPGKFPSPWTPKTGDTPIARPSSSSKLTNALYEARDAGKPRATPKARDDNDITIDVMEPRSESGKYWKEKYESYAERSEKEVKKLVAKQQVAKNFAKTKDAEAMELAARLSDERKRHQKIEQSLEAEAREYQRRLEKALAELERRDTEIAALEKRVKGLEIASAKMEVRSNVRHTPAPSLEDPESITVTERARCRSRAARGQSQSPVKRTPRRKSTRDFDAPAVPPQSGELPSELPMTPGRSPRKPAASTPKENVPPQDDFDEPSLPLPSSPDPWMEDFASGGGHFSFNRMALPLSTASAPAPPSPMHAARPVARASPAKLTKPRKDEGPKPSDKAPPRTSTDDVKASSIGDQSRAEAAKERLRRRKEERQQQQQMKA